MAPRSKNFPSCKSNSAMPRGIIGRAISEAAIHVAVADYLRVALHPHVFVSTIGHGGGGKVRGAQLKRKGLVPGIPDIGIIHRGQSYFIELKNSNGHTSVEQRACHEWLRQAGAKVEVCKSVAAVQRALRDWGLPTRIQAAVVA